MIGFWRSGDSWRAGAGRRDALDALDADTTRGDGVTGPPPASPSSDAASHAALGWTMVAVAAVVLAIGEVVKYFLAGRTLRSGGIPNITIIVGGLVGIVGFFVVPVIGLFLGFIVGAAATELVRTRDGRAAWRGTVAAIKAAAITMGIELLAALIATA